MSWACSMYGGEERRTDTGFWWGGLREGDHLGDPDVDGSSESGMGYGLDLAGSG